jgi:purine-binding chemotaxis protein CheW
MSEQEGQPFPPEAVPEPVPDAVPEAEHPQGTVPESVAGHRERLPYLGVFVGQEVYGLPLGQLREVARVTRLRHVPGAPRGVAGLVNLRGEIVCALDVRAILGLSPRIPTESAFLVALRDFEDPIGLIVDTIAEIYSIDPGDIEPAPVTWPPERRACFVGTVRVPEGTMGLLDVSQVVKI